MRIEPDNKYRKTPCSYIGIGCAYENIYGRDFDVLKSEDLSSYPFVKDIDKYIRQYFKVDDMHYLKGSERITFKQFLATNTKECLVYVYGHFMYVNGKDYWSFYNVDHCEVVCIWYLDEVHYEFIE